MGKKIAFLFPGQGSQYVGMGKDFYDSCPVAKEVFDKADEILGYKFSDLIFFGPKDELTLTKNSQLAIFIVSYAIFKAFKHEVPSLTPYACAGLSLGEYTALAASGKISFEECITLVKLRAEFMNDACITNPGSMSVVLGMQELEVEQALSLIENECVKIANLNCPGQIVIAGSHQGLEVAAAILKEKGAKRILPLDVSGAFHSLLMMPARENLAPYLTSAALSDTPISIVMNTPGDFVYDAESMRKNLIMQVTEPVRWERGILSMVSHGIDLFVEMGCGKTLSGMNKRIGVEHPTLSIEKVTDLHEVAKEMTACNC